VVEVENIPNPLGSVLEALRLATSEEACLLGLRLSTTGLLVLVSWWRSRAALRRRSSVASVPGSGSAASAASAASPASVSPSCPLVSPSS